MSEKKEDKIKLGVAVYDLMQAEKIKGKFDKKAGVWVDTKKVYIKYAEKHNENYAVSGSYYQLNKEENEAYLESAKEKNPKIEGQSFPKEK